MKHNESNDETQPGKRSGFTVMNNVRDYCEQPDMKKFLLLVVATYCNGDGICYPSNETLAKNIGKSRRTVKRMLRELVAAGEMEILAPGGGDRQRILCLRRYAEGGVKAMTRGGVKAMTRGVGSRSLGKTAPNSHRKQPINNKSSAHAEFVRLWCERFQTVTGERYVFQGGKDGKAVKLLLSTTGLTPSQLIAIAEQAWNRPSGFFCKLATSISGFNSRFNEIRRENKDAMAITTSGRDAGRLARARRSQYAGVGKLR